MPTKKSTTQKSHISLQRAAELQRNITSLQDKFELLFARTNDHQNRISALEDRVAFLTKQSSDAFCTAELNGKAVVEMAKKQSIDAARISDIEAQWRQHSKVSMERYQETRNLQTSLMDTNKRLGAIETRVYEIDMKKVGFAQFAQLWQHEDAHKTAKAATDYVTNPACRPREDLWVAMGYCSERLKVEIHGPFTYAEAKRFCNDARYSDYAVLPLED